MFNYINYQNIDNLRIFLENAKLNKSSFLSLEEENFNLYSSINSESHYELLESESFLTSPLRQLSVNFFNSLNRKIEHKNILLKISKAKFLEEYSSFSYIENKEKIFLSKLILRVQQKIAYLNKFQKNSKVVFYEFFNTTENIDNRENNTLNIDIESSTLTLPIKEDIKSKVKEVRILTGSNGLPGDPFTGNNKLIYKMLEDDSSIFQYSKLDFGPLKLVLEFILTEETVLNEFLLCRNSQFNDCNIVIDDIIFKNLYEEKFHLRTLIDASKQKLSCDSYRLEDGVKITHLPVKAKKVELHLSCEDYDVIQGRKIFSIDIKNVEFHSKKYQSEGVLYFTEQNIDKTISAFSASITESIYPRIEDNSKRVVKKIKFDNEGYIDCSDTSLILNEEKSSYAIYYELKRAPKIEKVLLSDEQYKSVNTEYERKVFSKNFNPNEYNINPNEYGLKVFQPDIYRRTREIRNSTYIGDITSGQTVNKFLLPLNLNELNINSNDANVYINEFICIKYFTENDFYAAQGNRAFFSEDGDHLFVSTDMSLNSLKCRINFMPKSHSIKALGDFLYLRINENFDPTKNNVSAKQIKRRPSFYTNNLSFTNGLIVINKENILEETVVLLNKTGENINSQCLISVNSDSLVIKNSEIQDGIIVEFNYKKTFSIESFNFWTNENKEYLGLSINSNEIELENKTETLNRNIKKLDLMHKSILESSFIIDNSAFDLKELEEVVFFNGKHELLNLGYIEKEILPIIVANNSSVTTTISREPCLDELSIKVKKNDEYIDVQYEMLDKRVIKLFINDEDTKGYSIEYFYKKRTEVNKVYYSVNYSDGIIYFSEETKGESDIQYSYVDLEISYNIIKDCNSFKEYGNGLQVDVTGLTDVNQNLKFVWHEASESFSIEGIEEYYSPIVYDIKMEMA